ncbi:hypothetical protein NC653_040411 [Populus alba x Populus x berolinensis]|uniref:DUF4283 domain-containing protein n=1 Tax=Populus alba x Populus x berolinensis TaxID=444605 RepID=A0AAD6LDY2_9ROSI|nr:hypothetical protein NC653_040406 [Populus alba x Populus x berolinensis]KAJ6958773.1 hypothetical protein NC653_040411 [Populus alba x Populus x berolinensis]
MLDIISNGPYFIFGRPLILKVMPGFFYFQPSDMARIPTWVRFPNLLLCYWTLICLFKITSMVGKPIHYNVPTTNMTRLLYARILIEVDFLQDLPVAVNVILPNGTPFSQQITFESLPCFCKSPSEETVVVEKQQPYKTTPPMDPPVDPMFTEVVIKVVQLSKDGDPPTVEPPKRQYLTRSRPAALLRHLL